MSELTATSTGTGPRAPALVGAAAIAPMIVAYVPFALVVGSTAATSDSPVAGWAGSWIIYGGSAHLAALHGIATGSAVLAIVTALLVNTRLLVYGASIAPRWSDQPRWFRLVAPTMLVDPTWSLADRYASADLSRDAYRRVYLGAGLALGFAWSGMIAVGAIFGSRLPEAGLGVAAPLCMLAMIGPRLRKSEQRAAAIAAAVITMLTADFPAGTGILVAIVAGVVAAQLPRSAS